MKSPRKHVWATVSAAFLGYESAAAVSDYLHRVARSESEVRIPYVTDLFRGKPWYVRLVASIVVGLLVYIHFDERI